jgi:hypothetical protein
MQVFVRIERQYQVPDYHSGFNNKFFLRRLFYLSGTPFVPKWCFAQYQILILKFFCFSADLACSNFLPGVKLAKAPTIGVNRK